MPVLPCLLPAQPLKCQLPSLYNMNPPTDSRYIPNKSTSKLSTQVALPPLVPFPSQSVEKCMVIDRMNQAGAMGKDCIGTSPYYIIHT